MPPWAPELPTLGEIDSGVVDPNASMPTGSVPDDTTADVPSTTPTTSAG
jgi:hypothetical protein